MARYCAAVANSCTPASPQPWKANFQMLLKPNRNCLDGIFSEGGFEEKAIAYLTIAGERAVKRGANAEVIRHFHRALESLIESFIELMSQVFMLPIFHRRTSC